ncbi:MAG: hypothetical protein JWM82_4246 [Myxococcales bacterium]|nr:hypothetical protein [Myxococcales bacterium]
MSPHRLSRWLGVGLLIAAGAGCGDSRVPPEDPSVCTDAWQPLTPPKPFDITSSLAYRDGVLYFMTGFPETLFALSTDGRTQNVLAPVFGWDPWIEGDQILYWVGNQVFGVPLTGGAAELRFDGGVDRRGSSTAALRHASTPTDFFWTENPILNGPTNVWRAPRVGGAPAKLGTATATEPPRDPLPFQSTMAVSNDSVVLASLFGIAVAVPLDGSAPRPLARPAGVGDSDFAFISDDADGVTWSIPRSTTNPLGPERKLVLAPADGSAVRDLWPALPAEVQPLRSWPDGNGGRILATVAPFADARFHAEIWTLSADGIGKRLACAPTSAGLSVRIDVRPAVTKDAVYLIAVDDTWQVVRVPR